MGDLEDRKLWPAYQRAYDDVLETTSTDHAPWFVVPADKKWYRDFAVLTILTSVLETLKPAYPARHDLDGLVIPGAKRVEEGITPKPPKSPKQPKNLEPTKDASDATDATE